MKRRAAPQVPQGRQSAPGSDAEFLLRPLEERIRTDWRYVLTGCALTVLLHGASFGYILYASYRAVSAWRSVMELEIVSEPARWGHLRMADRAILMAPLHYPPGLVASADEAARRRHEERRRRERAVRRAREHLQGSAEPTWPQTWEELQERVREEARKLNIGPIREAILEIYRAKQEGRLAFETVTVAVSFRVQKDGSLTDVVLTEPSGIPQVDAAALMIVEEASRARILAPLASTQSVTVRFAIAEETELLITALSPSETGAAQLVSQLNGLLLLARLNERRLDPQAASLLSRLHIAQEGRLVTARVRVPRAEASEIFRSRIGSGG